MVEQPYGNLVFGDEEGLKRSYERFQNQPVDWDLCDGEELPVATEQTTIRNPVQVAGPGTFFGKATSTLRLEPTEAEGWWFDRTDIPGALPIRTSVRNVWTTGSVVSNIVLRSGPPENYMRMVEHIIALKFGMGIDNLMIRVDSGDPPIFERGSLPLVEAIESAEVVKQTRPATYYTVKEPVSVAGPGGSFLAIAPCEGKPVLEIDSAVDFKTAIGKQRIRFPLTYGHFRYGSEARTNSSLLKVIYSLTIGRLFADIRNMGYNTKNVVIASRFGYVNKPRLVHEGKPLESAWHRAVLDLLAALALLDQGRFVARVTSYKAGHWLDVRMMRELHKRGLLEETKV